MNAYLYMIKIKLLLAFTYKYDFFVSLLHKVILLFATVFFWKAAYNGIDSVASVNEQQMLIYTVISVIMSGFIGANSVEWIIQGKIRTGNVALDFIKPVNVFLMYFSEDVGGTVTSFFQAAVPIFICSSLFIIIPLPVSLLNFTLFLLSFILGYIISWMISAIFGLFYFWVINMGPLGIAKDYIISIISGAFIPIWFFPQGVQTVLKFLPFIYIYQHPLGIYIGRTPVEEALFGIIIQVFWCLALGISFNLLKKKVESNILIQGG